MLAHAVKRHIAIFEVVSNLLAFRDFQMLESIGRTIHYNPLSFCAAGACTQLSLGWIVNKNRQTRDPDVNYGFDDAKAAADFILARTKLRPKIGIVLGSGLGKLGDQLTKSVAIRYRDIPKFPVSTAVGHPAELVIGRLETIPLAVMKGRVHLYEGYSPRAVAFPVRVLGLMGITALILTNAAGGINLEYGQGRLVLIRDHINLQGQNPLAGANDERFGTRFPDMSDVYAKEFRETAEKAAGSLGVTLSEGVYAALAGPSYETPAEIRYLRGIGADLVGMSTVPEAIAARHMNIRVLGISCVTNMAAGILPKPINHAEVLEVTNRVQSEFLRLLHAIVPRIFSLLA